MAITRVSTSSVREGLDKFNTALAGFSPAYGAFESISTVTVGAGGQAIIDFTSIPQTYRALQIRGMFPFSAQDAVVSLRWNGVSTSSYRYHWMYGNNTSALAYSNPSLDSQFTFAYDVNRSFNASFMKVFIVDVIDYSSTSKNKVFRSFSGIETNSNGNVELASGLRVDTAAITSIRLQHYGNDGTYGYKNFNQYSTFALYGIR